MTIAKKRVDLFQRWSWDDVDIPGYSAKVPDLGHAGAMIVNGRNGATRYYEYGRYDRAQLGEVRKWAVRDAVVKDGLIEWASLKPALRRISMVAGGGGRIEAALIATNKRFDAMDAYATARLKGNRNPQREPYDLTRNSCVHFAKGVVEAGGIESPWMIDPRPNSYIGEFQGQYPDLRYDPGNDRLVIEGKGAF